MRDKGKLARKWGTCSKKLALLIFTGLSAHPCECGTQHPPRMEEEAKDNSQCLQTELGKGLEGWWGLYSELRGCFPCFQKARWISMQLASSVQLGSLGSWLSSTGLEALTWVCTQTSRDTSDLWIIEHCSGEASVTELTAWVQELLGVREGNIPQFFINEKTDENCARNTKELTFLQGNRRMVGGSGAVLRNGLWYLQGWLCWCGKVTSMIRAKFDAKEAELSWARLVPRGCGKGSCSQPAYHTLVLVGKDI